MTAVTAAATEMLYALLLVKLVKYLVCFCYTVFVAEVTMTIKGRKNTSGIDPETCRYHSSVTLPTVVAVEVESAQRWVLVVSFKYHSMSSELTPFDQLLITSY